MTGHRFTVDCTRVPWSVTSGAMSAIRKQWYAYGGTAQVSYNHGTNHLEVVLSGCDDLNKIAFAAAVCHWFAQR